MKLEEYLNKGVSPYHVVKTVRERLLEEGFEELSIGDMKKTDGGKGYFISPYPSAIFAFRINPKKEGMHIAMAHTDSPSFLLKPDPEMPDKPYMRVNVEPYGGMLKRTWFDRPLGIAGRVMIRNNKDLFEPEQVLFDSKRPWFVIPSLAPHLDRDVETEKIDVQKILIPLYALSEKDEKKDSKAGRSKSSAKEITLISKIAETIGKDEKDILSYDLYLYNADKAEYVGTSEEMLLAPRIDNIASVAALTEGIISVKTPKAKISMTACFDNEEIGSRSKQGADSELLKIVLEDLYGRLGKQEDLSKDYMKSMMLSVDGAHGLHPNYKEKSDVTAKVMLGGGVVLKSSASQRYVTDSKAGAILKGLCEKNRIPLQVQANRSGAPGGQTLGPIVSSYLPILAADIGIPMLAMHSARELAAIKDQEALSKLIETFM